MKHSGVVRQRCSKKTDTTSRTHLRCRTLVLHDLHCTVQRAFVLVSFEPLLERTTQVKNPANHWNLESRNWTEHSTHLHSGLDHIQGSVSEHAGGTSDGSKRTGHHGVNGLVGVLPLVIHKIKEVNREHQFGLECVTAGLYSPLYQFLSTVMT